MIANRRTYYLHIMDSEKKKEVKRLYKLSQRRLKEQELKELLLCDLILAFMQLQITWGTKNCHAKKSKRLSQDQLLPSKTLKSNQNRVICPLDVFLVLAHLLGCREPNKISAKVKLRVWLKLAKHASRYINLTKHKSLHWARILKQLKWRSFHFI